MNWIWVVVPIIAIAAPFAYMIVGKWMDYQVQLAEAQGASDVRRRLAAAEEALVVSEHRLEKLEAVVVDQLLDAPAEPLGIDAGRVANRTQESPAG